MTIYQFRVTFQGGPLLGTLEHCRRPPTPRPKCTGAFGALEHFLEARKNAPKHRDKRWGNRAISGGGYFSPKKWVRQIYADWGGFTTGHCGKHVGTILGVIPNNNQAISDQKNFGRKFSNFLTRVPPLGIWSPDWPFWGSNTKGGPLSKNRKFLTKIFLVGNCRIIAGNNS